MLLRRDDAGALFLLLKAQFDALKASKRKSKVDGSQAFGQLFVYKR